MKYTKKLFQTKHLYDLSKTDALFVKAMQENCAFCYENCEDYKRILTEAGFSPDRLDSIDRLEDLVFRPRSFLSRLLLPALREPCPRLALI